LVAFQTDWVITGVTTPATIAASINDTGGKFVIGINDTGGKFASGINNTGCKFFHNTGGKFATGVDNASVNLPPVSTTPVANSGNN
jgi:hypothetical protein